MKFTHLQIDDVSYKVLDSKARRCATFEYIDAPDRKLPAGVHLDLDVRSWVTDKILMVNAKKADMLYLVGIYEYVMEVSMQFACIVQNRR